MLMLIGAGIGNATIAIEAQQGAVFAEISLIILLCIAQILWASKYWDGRLSSTLNTAISSLLLVFCAIVLKILLITH
jgi:hypothetical protein